MGLLRYIRRFLTPPTFEGDALKTRRAWLLSLALTLVIIGMPVLIVGNLLGARTPGIVIGLDVVIVVGSLSMLAGVRRGCINEIAVLFVLGMWATTTISIAALGTIRTPTSAVYLLLVVMAGFLFERRGIVATIGLSALAILFLIVAENAGWLPHADLTVTITQGITYTALFAFTGGLTYYALSEIRQALHRVDRELAERKKAETTLRAITDNMYDMVSLLDAQGIVQFASPSHERHLGYRPEELIGRSGFEFMHPDDRATLREGLQVALQTKAPNPQPLEFRSRHADGHYVVLEATAQYLRSDNQITGIVAAFRDVTERQKMEQALRRQHSALTSLYQITLDILKHHSLDDLLRTLAVHAAALLDAPYCEIMVLDGDELVVRATTPNQTFMLGDRTHADQARLSWQAVFTLEPTGMDDYSSWEHHRAVYDRLALHAVASFPIINGDHCLGVLDVSRTQPGYVFDQAQLQAGKLFAQLAALALDNAQWYAAAESELAERIQAEELLRQSNLELQTRNEELDAFGHTVAHDLKNPLGVMMGFADMLAEDPATFPAGTIRQIMQGIIQSGQKASSIIDSLLMLATVRKQDVLSVPLDMAYLVDEALLRLADTIHNTGAVISLPDRSSWPVVQGHAPWVEGIWFNYLSNALKYGGTPPRIELSTTLQPDGFVRFNVRDHGAGLTAEQQARLFAPFERLEQARVQGHGLGLSIVRRVANKLGGQVGVESVPGQGSIFYFTLPAVTSTSSLQQPISAR